MNRGRSRQVSSTAIARKASHERRIHRSPSPSSSSPPSSSSSSSSSMSPDYDYDDSLDSPPETLEDQVHIAYADDNIHLAKILLLRLKGIEVNGDNDPRIAEVRDEDFDYCFAPHGGLVMDPSDEKALLERRRLELQRQEQQQRITRLRMCEQKWTMEKRRLREERMLVLKKREMKRVEEEQRRQRREQEERARVQQQDRRREARLFQLRTRPRLDHQVASYTRRSPQNSSDSDSEEDGPSSFVYDFMVTAPLSRNAPRRRQPTSPLARSPNASHSDRLSAPIFDDSRSVNFTEVLASMRGALFPLTHEERARRTQSPTASKPRSRSRSKGPGKPSHSQVRRRKEAELFQALLATPATIEEGRRWSQKGKGKGKTVFKPKNLSGVCSECRRSPSTSSSQLSSPVSISSSSSTSSRPSSWLSFGSSASASSTATTPSSSPSPSRRSSWFKSSASPVSPSSRRSSWLSPGLVSPPSSPIETQAGQSERQCRCHCGHLTPINITDSPLLFESESAKAPSTAPQPYTTSLESVLGSIRTQRRTQAASTPSATLALLSNVSQTVSSSVTQLVGLAKGFQQAYVAAAMFSVAASCDGDRWEEREVAYQYDEVRGVRVVVRPDIGLHQRGRSVEVKGRLAGVDQKTRKANMGMKRVGRRVSPKDVATFLAVNSCCSCAGARRSVSESADGGDQQKDATNGVTEESCGHFRPLSPAPVKSKYLDIPLGSPYAPRQQPPSTVLPRVLPYKLHFKPVPVPSRCPFRFNAFSHVHTTYPEQEPVPDYRPPQNPCSSGTVRGINWRIRSVGNPAYLRLRALQNVVWRKGLDWEGRGRELSMGGGRDRVVGVAYEGVGCSKLSGGSLTLGGRR